MGENDFDREFDFEDEYGFDPKSFLDAEEYDDDIDLSEFSDEKLGLSAQPEKTVSRYAIRTVTSSILPADLPMSAIAGVTRPRIISGIRNCRRLLNMALKVAAMRTSH